MKLKEYTQEEINAMSYDDVAFEILTDVNRKMKINELFKEVAAVYNLSDDAFVSQIGDFFELLSTDQRFIMLEDGSWDLKTKHSRKVIIEEDDEEELLVEAIEDDENEYEEENSEEEIFYDGDDTEDTEDDLQDLVVVDEDSEDDLI